jgi:D-alanyl-D-alanine endopeptidase (penicillin-binding protein 7)
MVAVVDQERGELVFSRNAYRPSPIASITKLMTAMVVLDADADLSEQIAIQASDVDKLKHSGSRLRVGAVLSRGEMLRLALMASENRAAAALARAAAGGTDAFVFAMNQKARQLGLKHTRFVDSTGLHPDNLSTAHELAILVNAAYKYPLIRHYSTMASHPIRMPGRRSETLYYRNSNRLVADERWSIGLSKTGYIREAGRCLVMQATIAARPVVIVLLNAPGKKARIADAARLKTWLERLGHSKYTVTALNTVNY